FFALAFYGHLRLRQALHKNDRWWILLAVISFILALGSKEMAIMFPVIAFFYDLLFFRLGVVLSTNNTVAPLHPRRLWRSKSFYIVFGIYGVISLLYLYNHLHVIKGITNLNVGGNYMADWRAPGFFSAIGVNLVTY